VCPCWTATGGGRHDRQVWPHCHCYSGRKPSRSRPREQFNRAVREGSWRGYGVLKEVRLRVDRLSAKCNLPTRSAHVLACPSGSNCPVRPLGSCPACSMPGVADAAFGGVGFGGPPGPARRGPPFAADTPTPGLRPVSGSLHDRPAYRGLPCAGSRGRAGGPTAATRRPVDHPAADGWFYGCSTVRLSQKSADRAHSIACAEIRVCWEWKAVR